MFTSNYRCLHTGVPYNTAYGWNRPKFKAQCWLQLLQCMCIYFRKTPYYSEFWVLDNNCFYLFTFEFGVQQTHYVNTNKHTKNQFDSILFHKFTHTILSLTNLGRLGLLKYKSLPVKKITQNSTSNQTTLCSQTW